MSLPSIDDEISSNISKQKNANNFPSIDGREMKMPLFDASRNDESNELLFIFLRSIDEERLDIYAHQKLAIQYY